MTAPMWHVTQGRVLSVTVDIDQAITGYTPRITFKKASSGWQAAVDDSGAPLTLTTGSGITVTDAAAGVMSVVMTKAQSAALETGAYQWDLQLSNGTDVRVVEWDQNGTTVGQLTVQPAVTKTTP